MAVSGAPVGRKVAGHVKAGKAPAGKMARAIGSTGRKPRTGPGGNPNPNALDALVNGKRANGKLAGS